MTLFRVLVISGFRREVYEKCSLVGYYAESSGSYFERIQPFILVYLLLLCVQSLNKSLCFNFVSICKNRASVS